MLGPTGLSGISLNIASIIHSLQTGFIYHYSLIILFAITFFFSILEV